MGSWLHTFTALCYGIYWRLGEFVWSLGCGGVVKIQGSIRYLNLDQQTYSESSRFKWRRYKHASQVEFHNWRFALLRVYLNINQLDALDFIMSFFFKPLHVLSTCGHRQEVKIVLYSLWYHHTYRWPSRAQVERGLSHQFHKWRSTLLRIHLNINQPDALNFTMSALDGHL